MLISGSIHNEDMSQQILCAKTHCIQMYKRKMFAVGESDRNKIELIHEKNALSFR